MDSHDKEFFDRLMMLTEENNKLLHRMRRTSRIVGITRVVYWVVLIGVSIGAYYYIQPYLEQLLAVYGNIQHVVNPFSR